MRAIAAACPIRAAQLAERGLPVKDTSEGQTGSLKIALCGIALIIR